MEIDEAVLHVTDLKKPKNSSELKDVEGEAGGSLLAQDIPIKDGGRIISSSERILARNKGNPNKEPIDDLA